MSMNPYKFNYRCSTHKYLLLRRGLCYKWVAVLPGPDVCGTSHEVALGSNVDKKKPKPRGGTLSANVSFLEGFSYHLTLGIALKI